MTSRDDVHTSPRAPRRPEDRQMTIRRGAGGEGAEAEGANARAAGAGARTATGARTAFAVASARVAARKKKRRRIVVALCVVAVLAALGVGAFALFGGAQDGGVGGVEVFFDPNAKTGQAPNKTPEEIQAELDRIVEEGMFDISIASVIDFDSPGAAGKAYIENVPGNRYDMAVSIRLDGTDEEVYSSRGIAPGNYIEDIALARELAPGNHDATATFTAYDRETHAEVGSAAAKVKLMVGGADADKGADAGGGDADAGGEGGEPAGGDADAADGSGEDADTADAGGDAS